MEPDMLFAEKQDAKDFDFGAKTAAVFDDMLERSVPFYVETQRMMAELASDFVQPGTNVYDLGCSTGTTFVALDGVVPADVKFIGIDSSVEMLEKAHQKLANQGMTRPYDLRCADLNDSVFVENASLVVMNLTLQFVRPLYRDRLISQVAAGLVPNGALLLVEKVLGDASDLNRLFIKHYYELKKRNGYSDMEISQKREALENILIPYRMNENSELLLRNGFRECEVFFKWYNFCSYVAIK